MRPGALGLPFLLSDDEIRLLLSVPLALGAGTGPRRHLHHTRPLTVQHTHAHTHACTHIHRCVHAVNPPSGARGPQPGSAGGEQPRPPRGGEPTGWGARGGWNLLTAIPSGMGGTRPGPAVTGRGLAGSRGPPGIREAILRRRPRTQERPRRLRADPGSSRRAGRSPTKSRLCSGPSDVPGQRREAHKCPQAPRGLPSRTGQQCLSPPGSSLGTCRAGQRPEERVLREPPWASRAGKGPVRRPRDPGGPCGGPAGWAQGPAVGPPHLVRFLPLACSPRPRSS